MLGNEPRSTATLIGFLLHEREQSVPLLETGPGMTVLYGLNGAGKSRIISDVERFFGGIASDAIAFIRLASEHNSIDWNRETDRGDWFPDWARRAGGDSLDAEEILREWAEVCLSAEPVTMPGIPPTSSVHREDRIAALVDEWLQEPLILVKAVGSVQRRGWASAPAFRTGSAAPSANDEVETYEIYDQHAVHDHLAEIALTPYGHDGQGRTIACASHSGQSVLEVDAIPFSAGIHDRLIDLSPTIHSAGEDIHDRTKRHLARTVSDAVQVAHGAAGPSIALIGNVDQLVSVANQHFGGVLRDAPRLRLHVDPIGLNTQVRWYAEEDDPGELPGDRRSSIAVERLDEVRTLEELSTAQLRWALWSIDMALTSVTGPSGRVRAASPSRLYLLDEPEAALHRSAESHMAQYLIRLAAEPDSHVLLATHSPELLETSTSRVYEVSRDPRGWRGVRVLDAASRENMEALGLQPADLLRRQRGLILVEGLHDEIVLEQLFGDQMRRLRVELLPLRGTTELSPAKVSFLFAYTPAHLFVMLDNIQSSELTGAWHQALEHFSADDAQAAQRAITEASCLSTTDEGKKLAKVLVEVLSKGDPNRMTPFGLSLGDIVEYLPVEALVGGSRSWTQLRDDHSSRKKDAPTKTAKDFKKWLTTEFSADFGPDAVRAAAQRLDAPPPDLMRLWKTVEARVDA